MLIPLEMKNHLNTFHCKIRKFGIICKGLNLGKNSVGGNFQEGNYPGENCPDGNYLGGNSFFFKHGFIWLTQIKNFKHTTKCKL